MANTVTINGVTITSSGDASITIFNGRVLINGENVTPDAKEISIRVEGDCGAITADVCQKITVTGNTGPVRTQSGDVDCGSVNGGVTTMSGDVVVRGNVGGSISTMSGDISTSQGRDR